jgi:hypothetical protein
MNSKLFQSEWLGLNSVNLKLTEPIHALGNALLPYTETQSAIQRGNGMDRRSDI